MKYCSLGLWNPTNNPDEVLQSISTKVHPSNQLLASASLRLDSTDDEDSQRPSEFDLASDHSSRAHEVRVLSYNL